MAGVDGADLPRHAPGSPPARRRTRPAPGPLGWPVLGAVAAGGALGALARHGVTVALPRTGDGFPWATFGVNTVGCLLIGVLMVLLTRVRPGRRLLRPFLAVGVLGGFTTFSTYALDVHRIAAAGRSATALTYLAATLVGALVGVLVGAAVAGAAVRAADRGADGRGGPAGRGAPAGGGEPGGRAGAGR